MEAATASAVRLDSGDAGVSRVAFLQMGAAGTVAVLGLTTGGHFAKAISALTGSVQPAPLTRSAYAPHIGSIFRVHTEGASAAPVRMRLTSLADTGPTRGHEHAFSLLFTASRTAKPLAGGIQLVEHPQMGRFQLAMVPVGRGAHVQDYQAIINRVPGSPGRPRN